MEKKTIIWIIAILVVVALLVWGFMSLGGDEEAEELPEGLVVDSNIDSEGGQLIQDSIVDEDDVDLGEVV